MADSGFRIAGAYVSVSLDDQTQADEKQIRARLERSGPVNFATALKDPSNTRIVRDRIQKALSPINARVAVDDSSIRSTASKVDSETQKMAARANAQFNLMGIAASFAGLPAAAAVAGAGVAAGLAGVPLAFAGIGAAALASDAAVSSAFDNLTTNVRDGVTGAASVMEGDLVDSINMVGETAQQIEPQLSGLFAAGGADLKVFTGGVLDAARNALPGLQVAAANSEAPVRGLAAALATMGSGASSMFAGLAQGAQGAEQDLRTLGGTAADAERFLGTFLAQLANNGGPTLSTFRSGLQSVESTVLALTSATSPLYGASTGFIEAISGGLGVVRTFAELLSTLPPEVSQTAGGLLAATKILDGFGISASGAFSGFGKSIVDATGFSGKFEAGIEGLTSAALNPAMLATAGLGAALLIMGREQDEAAQAANRNRATVESLTSALRASNGAITDNVRAAVAQDLAQQSNADSGTSMLQIAKQMGVDLPTLTNAIMGNAAATAEVNREIDAYKQQNPQAAATADLLRIAVLSKTGAFKQSQQALIAEASAQDVSGASAGRLSLAQQLTQGATKSLNDAFKSLSDAESDSTTRAQGLLTVLDTLTGHVPSHEDAIQSLNDTIRQLADNANQAGFRSDGFGKALLNVDGTVNTTTKNGSTLLTTMESLEKGFSNAGASIDDLVRAGVPLQQATQQVNGELQTQRDRFLSVATQMGLTRDQAQQLANRYGLIPNEVTTLISQPGMLGAQEAADILRGKVLSVPDSHTTIASALTDDAVRRLEDLGFKVTHLPDGTVSVAADTRSAVSSIQSFYSNLIHPVTIPVRAGAPPLPLGGGAIGGVVKPFASGGFFPDLTPMSAVASVVPPNTYRVVGDRLDVSEAYIPLDGSRRSNEILDEANSAMGRVPAVAPTVGIDYTALAAANAQALGAVLEGLFSGGVKASFDTATMEKGLITLQRRRGRR